MNTLQFYHDKISKEAGYTNFLDLLDCCNGSQIHNTNLLTVVSLAAKLYAEEACKEQRKIDAKKAALKIYHKEHNDGQPYNQLRFESYHGTKVDVDRDTILNAPLAVNTEKDGK